MKTVLISAGDVSGDQHAAGFVRALRVREPDARFLGLGGREMEQAGVELLADQAELAVGGLLELGGSLPALAKVWGKMGRALDAVRPDLVVLVDAGGFNLPFAARVRRRSQAPILYYVAPQVWAWRRGRLKKIAKRVDRVAVLFPFEVDAYAPTRLPVECVGHPLVEPLGRLARGLGRSEARRRLGIPAACPLVVLLPGSRRNEIRHQLPIQLETARRLHALDPEIRFAVALAVSIEPASVDTRIREARLPATLQLRCLRGVTHELMRAGDVLLTKPGTSTVEGMLLGAPMVVMGRANPVTAAVLRRVLRVRWLAMPNLIAGAEIVPELLQERARPEVLAEHVLALMGGSERERQLRAMAAASARLVGGGAERASEIALEMMA